MLMTAALSGKADAVQAAADARRDAWTPRNRIKGQTALMWAAAEGNTAAADVLLEAGADVKAEVERRLHAVAVRGAQRAHRRPTVALLKRGANVNDVAPDGSSALSMAVRQRLLRAGVGAARSRRRIRTCPIRADRRSTPWRGCASPAPTAPPASATRPQGTPQQTGSVTALQLAKKLLEHGANPNIRVEWKEPTFGKEGGTARNPPNIRLGRHLLSYPARRRSTSPRRTAMSS